MKAVVFLVLNNNGPVRMTKGRPSLARSEIAIGIRLDVPESAFRSPIVMADLSVPEHAVIVPEIAVEVEIEQ